MSDAMLAIVGGLMAFASPLPLWSRLVAAGIAGAAAALWWTGYTAAPSEAAPSGDCAHLWSDWSVPRSLTEPYETRRESHRVQITMMQERSCLHCKLVQRSLT